MVCKFALGLCFATRLCYCSCFVGLRGLDLVYFVVDLLVFDSLDDFVCLA